MNCAMPKTGVVVSCLVAISLVWAFPSGAAVDLDSAAGLWLMDDGAGAVAEDSSLNGNDGQLTNGPAWVDGRYGKALAFNGVNSFVLVANPTGLPEGAAPRTVMLNFKWSEVKWLAPGIEPMGYGANANGRRLGVWIGSDKIVGVETTNFGVVFPWDGDTNWHHLAIAYPAGETKTDKFKLYFDGVAKVGNILGTAQDTATAPGPLTIGVLPAALVYYFNGIIDEVAIFPAELSPADIADVAQNGLVGTTAVSPSGKLATAWAHLKAR